MDNIFVELLNKLTAYKVDFVVCGGVAIFLHGVERTTYDLDILISTDTENLQRLIRAVSEINLKPRIPEPIENILSEEKRNEWVEKKGAIVYTLISDDSLKQIDILLKYPKSFIQLKDNAVMMNISGNQVLVSSIEDIIEAKMQIQPPRDKDDFDIQELRKIKNGK